jgi:hypothetical protein
LTVTATTTLERVLRIIDGEATDAELALKGLVAHCQSLPDAQVLLRIPDMARWEGRRDVARGLSRRIREMWGMA